MKILIASDLHGEFARHDYTVPEGVDFDVAVFAGDIDRGANSVKWLLGQRAMRDTPVMFVAGNHEYYRTILEDAAAEIRDEARGTHITFLDADAVPVIDGVRFLGCTLWTDYLFCARDHAEGLRAGAGINDYRFIRSSPGAEIPQPFTPKLAFRRHWKERRWLIDRLTENHEGPTVCISHHAVHPGSLHPKYAGAGALNASFISDLGSVIGEFQPAVWIHGHVHDSHDYVADGGTRIVCNPHGYTYGSRWENPNFDPACVIEIPEWTPRPKFGV